MLHLDEPALRFDGEQAEINVGKRLKILRAARGLSIRGLAGKSGLAVNTLSLIENGKTSPSVSTLQQLAAALKVPVTAFFKPDTEQKYVVHTPLVDRPQTEIDKATLQDLGAGLATRAVQPLVVTLKKGGGSGSSPIVHTGYEFVYCLKGRILYVIEEQSYLLDPGDSLLFESHLPHRWENVDMEESQLLLVLYPSDLRDRVTARHFGLT
jgi:transcriptional regulator with XRE-family HTH domain